MFLWLTVYMHYMHCAFCPSIRASINAIQALKLKTKWCIKTRTVVSISQHRGQHHPLVLGWRRGNALCRINRVTLWRARLVLGLVTVYGQVNHLGTLPAS